jgi:hypothetical protein
LRVKHLSGIAVVRGIRIVDTAETHALSLDFNRLCFSVQNLNPVFSQGVQHLVDAKAPILMVAGHIIAGVFVGNCRQKNLGVSVRQPVVEDIAAEEQEIRLLLLDGIHQCSLPLPIAAGMQIRNQGNADGRADLFALNGISHGLQTYIKREEQKEQNEYGRRELRPAFPHSTPAPLPRRRLSRTLCLCGLV